MCFNVSVEVGLDAGLVRAQRTRERLLSSVDAVMLHKVAALKGVVRARGTLVHFRHDGVVVRVVAYLEGSRDLP